MVDKQRYLTNGTLASQIIYPLDNQTLVDNELLQLLQLVKLEYLLEGNDDQHQFNINSSISWGDVLSPGEQQRISESYALSPISSL